MLKKILFLLVAFIATSSSFSQKKDKIKGSKIVTITLKELKSFENIEVNDNFEVLLVKGEQTSLEIEADDNLHEIINYEVSGNTLRINALKEAISFKKFSVRINYSDSLKLIIARNETVLKALADLDVTNITIKNYNESKSFLNVKSKNFSLILDDKSEAEINVKSENTTLELSKNSELKALITATDTKIDMYQKSSATVEGTTTNAKFRLDNNSDLTAKKFAIENLEIDIESYSKCATSVSKEIHIESSGKSQLELFGEPKITIGKFTDNATLYKKENNR